ncbi:MAG: Appr-1-p processing protein [Gammaproteobacteria bacterium]|nr:Appr-1-p processing protein [Gammaproteobacteria bacterium]
MLLQVTGDILLTKAQVIAHGVAPNDDFRQGLALALREQWPALYKDFRHYCKTTHVKPGEVWAWAGPGGRRIVSLFTQEAAYGQGEKPGRATVSYVSHALRGLRELIDREKFTSIALPRLATGVGRLAWPDVEPHIHEQLAGLKIPVVIYTTYRKGKQADEHLPP